MLQFDQFNRRRYIVSSKVWKKNMSVNILDLIPRLLVYKPSCVNENGSLSRWVNSWLSYTQNSCYDVVVIDDGMVDHDC